MSVRPNWTKTETGYRLHGASVEAELVRQGRRWDLLALGRKVDLGRRATFDSAEAELGRLIGDGES